MGPVGLGVVSQFTTFVGLITSTVHVGTPFSLSAILPGLYKDNDTVSKQKIFAYFRFFSGIFFIVTASITIIVVVFSKEITLLLLDNTETSIILLIVSVSIPFTVLYAIFEAFLRSSGQIGRMVRVSVYANLISLPLLVVLIQTLNLNGVAIYLAVFGILPFLFALTLYNKVFSSDFRLSPYQLTRSDKRNVFKTGVTSLLAFLFFQSVILYLRKFIILNFGLESNGLFQSVLGFSVTIFSLVYSFLSNHTLPQLSMQKSAGEINSVIDETARFLLLIVVPILLLVYSFRDLIIQLFYSKSFVSATNLILFQLLGDCFRIFASLFSLWLFSRFKVKQLIIVDFIFNALLLIIPNIFIKFIPDLRILPFSYMTASLIQFTLYFIYTKKTLDFKFTKKTINMIVLSLTTATASVIFSTYSTLWGYFFTGILLFVWIFTILKYIEQVSVKATIKNYFKKNSFLYWKKP